MEEKVSFTILLNCGMNEAVDKVTEALKSEGFGILTKIDVRETFSQSDGILSFATSQLEDDGMVVPEMP